jgi:hypothetical protein
LTSVDLRWDEHFFTWKALVDRHLALGITHLVFHTYTHNPRRDVVPGTSFGTGIGSPFLRGQTWWPHMRAFTDYVARSQYLLEKGRPVADVLWYLGDDVDHKPRQDAPFPAGWRFDYANADILQNRLEVVGDRLTTPEGVSWRLLWLRDAQRLVPATLEKIAALVRAGATVLADPPRASATLSGGADADRRFERLVEELWGARPGSAGERRLGRGAVLWGIDVETALTRLGVERDLEGAGRAPWMHRRTDDEEIFFVTAPPDQPLRGPLRFRASGQPVLMDPLDGSKRPLSVYRPDGAGTVVPLDLPPAGSTFVVFRRGPARPAGVRIERDGDALVDAGALLERHGDGVRLLAWQDGRYRIVPQHGAPSEVNVTGTSAVTLEGPWTLSFPPGWDTPARVDLPALVPWSALEEPATKHFSGTAVYERTFDLPGLGPGARVQIDLGTVADMATVIVNGKRAGFTWAPPHRVDISGLARPGRNRLRVEITNTWRNRLAYDASLAPEKRKTWTIAGPVATIPVEPAGLIGPVIVHLGRVHDVPLTAGRRRPND